MAPAAPNMWTKPAVIGIFSSLSLLAIYALTMSLLSGREAALAQFRALWWLMLPLSSGFGIQVGLYAKLKQVITVQSKTLLATSGTSAGVGMLACCVHHLTDVLPIIGLSGLSLFLVNYQTPILTASLIINLVGIFYMFKQLQNVKTARGQK